MTASLDHQTDSDDPSTEFEVPVPETDVGDAEDPPTCPYCERPFRRERLRDLHVGEVHAEECSDQERSAYEIAREEEKDDLFMFHMKIVVALGLLFFTFVFSYMAIVTLL